MISYSRVDTFRQCPYKYKLRYIDGLETVQAPLADDALILGTAFHIGLENGLERAVEYYKRQFNVWTDKHENELIKLEALIPKAQAALPNGKKQFETEINNGEFLGFLDCLVTNNDIEYQLLDFKYCSKSGLKRYPNSEQLHLYKHYAPMNITSMGYLCVPKVAIRQRQSEDLYQFRKRLAGELEKVEPVYIPIEYDADKVKEFEAAAQEMQQATEFEKVPSRLCDWCEYKEFCEKGSREMLIPSTERRTPGQTTRRKIWIYGRSFSGKTVMLDSAPNPLNLNTDGNVNFVTMPVIPIKDQVTVEGRITKRKFAWEVFKDVLAELEKKQNDFKTIIIDLVEDTREMCRLYEYDRLGIQHESDSGYGKGWDIIKTEYLSTMRRFFNLDYENLVIVSHEQASEIKKKNGQTITSISPNIQEAIANKLAGMCDLVARVVVEDDGTRTLNFKSDEYTFGGGRLRDIAETTIPLEWGELCRVYEVAQAKVANTPTTPVEQPQAETVKRGRLRDIAETPVEQPQAEPVKRTRKRRIQKDGE